MLEEVSLRSEDKFTKITLSQSDYIDKKNELQLVLRNNSIISLGPTKPGRYIRLLTGVVNLSYQNPTRDAINFLIKDMYDAYKEYVEDGCPYKLKLYDALLPLLKFLSEAYREEFDKQKLQEKFGEIKIQLVAKKPVKAGFLQNITNAFCCFFPCCKNRDKYDASINHSDRSERIRLLNT